MLERLTGYVYQVRAMLDVLVACVTRINHSVYVSVFGLEGTLEAPGVVCCPPHETVISK